MTVDNGLGRWLSRWFMRVEAAGNILRIVYFGGIFLTTGASALQSYGLDQYTPYFIVVTSLGTLLFAYLYAEGGLFNQKNRDKKDMGDNFASPLMRIDDELIGAAVFAAVHGRPPDDDEQEAISEAVEQPWNNYRDGIEVDQ